MYSQHFLSAFNVGAAIFVMGSALTVLEEVGFPWQRAERTHVVKSQTEAWDENAVPDGWWHHWIIHMLSRKCHSVLVLASLWTLPYIQRASMWMTN